MNLFKRKTTWTNAEFIPLKLAIGSAYLMIGTYFHDLFQQYLSIIGIVFIATVVWSLYLWLKKMKQENQ